jgi:hypothetical protein
LFSGAPTLSTSILYTHLRSGGQNPRHVEFQRFVVLGKFGAKGYHRTDNGRTWPMKGELETMTESVGEIVHEIKHNPWRLGVFYVDSADPRLIVRQRIGFGWTLNFGHPLAWIIVAAIVAIGLVRRVMQSEKG